MIAASRWIAMAFATGLLLALVLAVRSSESIADRTIPASPAEDRSKVALATVGRFSDPQGWDTLPEGIAARPAEADFAFDKKVMLKSDYDRTESCAGSVDGMSVYYNTMVTYCYLFTNVGTSTFITHTLVDDKLGGTGSFEYYVAPSGGIGFVGEPPAGLVQDTTNTATWTAVDDNDVQASRTDRVTVSVVMPLSGYVFIDVNGNGLRDGDETTGVSGVQVLLEAQPADPNTQWITHTLSSGYYHFPEATAGSRIASVTLPAGYVATSPTSVPVDLVFGVAKSADFGVLAFTPTPTRTATPRPTSTRTPTRTATPGLTPTSTSTATLTPEVTPSETPWSTVTPTDTPTSTPTVTLTQSPEPTPSATATPLVTASPTSSTTPPAHAVYLPLVLDVPPGTLPPFAPTLMAITPPGALASYHITWTSVYGADRYELEQAGSADFASGPVVVYSGSNASFTARSSGVGTHYYRVRALNVVGPSSWSDAQAVYLSWETEPNDSIGDADGQLVSREPMYALPHDSNDYFAVRLTEAGPITASVEWLSGPARVSLYYEDIGSLIVADSVAPYLVSSYGQPGVYYLRVFVETPDDRSAPYLLTATFR